MCEQRQLRRRCSHQPHSFRLIGINLSGEEKRGENKNKIKSIHLLLLHPCTQTHLPHHIARRTASDYML